MLQRNMGTCTGTEFATISKERFSSVLDAASDGEGDLLRFSFACFLIPYTITKWEIKQNVLMADD